MMTDSIDLATLKLRVAIDPETGCWRWQGMHNHDGYGLIALDGRQVRVHRVVYALAKGDLDPALVVDHVWEWGCRHRDCCNPAHLEQITQTDNLRRQRARNKNKTHCLRGHPFNTKNTLRYTAPGDGVKRRYCRACQRVRREERRAREVAVAA